MKNLCNDFNDDSDFSETKAQSSLWKLPEEPRPKISRHFRSNMKVLPTVFFNINRVVYRDYQRFIRTIEKMTEKTKTEKITQKDNNESLEELKTIPKSSF